MRKIRHLLIISHDNVENPCSWSGTPYHIKQAFERHIDQISVVTCLKTTRNPIDLMKRVIYGPNQYPLWITASSLHTFAHKVERSILDLRPDAIFSISSQYLVKLRVPLFKSIPIIMFSDAPWILWYNTYKRFHDMPILAEEFAIAECELAQQLNAIVYGSDWAADFAVTKFGISRDVVHALPLGANWTSNYVVKCKDSTGVVLRLLFIGKDWLRKGGPFAIDIARALRKSGVATTMDIVGCSPEISAMELEWIKVHGFVNMVVRDDYELMQTLMATAHFLVVPSESECFGLVFAEAHAFGLPSIGRAIHAVPSIIEDGVTGILIRAGESAESIACRIMRIVSNAELYSDMCAAAFLKYKTQLNWDAFALGVLKIFASMASGKMV